MQHRLDLGIDPAALLASLLPTEAMRETWVRGYLVFGSVRSPDAAGGPPAWAMRDAAHMIWTEEERAELDALRAAAVYGEPSYETFRARCGELGRRVGWECP